MHYITEYNADWPRRFKQIAESLRIHCAQGWKIHHVGSTSVPGMPAKDIIDLDIECPVGAMPAVIRALAAAGYEHEGDLGIPTRESFRPFPDSLAATLPIHHLYACESDSPELFKHLAFRNYLISHSSRANWLAEQKRLADANGQSRAEYIQNKSAAYVTIVDEASAWAKSSAG